MTNPQLLNVHNLSFSYHKENTLSNINLTFNKGTFTGIIGPNGAGKSTLIRILAGLLDDFSGDISLCNKAIQQYERKELALKLSYVPQSIELEFPFPVNEVVSMGRFPHQKTLFVEDDVSQAVVKEAISQMDLTDLKSRPFTELSGGEKQRTVIASALAQQAPLLLLDEPTTALDIRHQQLILQNLKKLVQTKQQSIILVTHDINLAAQFCDRMILMHKGEIIADDSPKEVLQFNRIQEVYGAKVYIDINPFTDSIYILPYSTEK